MVSRNHQNKFIQDDFSHNIRIFQFLVYDENSIKDT
ncbi:hypothetical protein TFUB20_00075 [Tannerella forsythia]|uniref:Uncharacterized protein n=1 Tax=Tannerella forsythia TaxID=28112 RepID=A0A1D3UC02_TANFO|nr:hypothetical protein TFUB20_00075 [Tannerella forsythia]